MRARRPCSMTRADLLAHELFSQVELHRIFGGVVPELASRDHVRRLLPLVKSALCSMRGNRLPEDLSGVVYTAGPGLIGALLTGAALGRSLAYGVADPGARRASPGGASPRAAPRDRAAAVSARGTARLRRPHDAHRGARASAATRSSARRATMRPARRSTRPQSFWVCPIPAARELAQLAATRARRRLHVPASHARSRRP